MSINKTTYAICRDYGFFNNGDRESLEILATAKTKKKAFQKMKHFDGDILYKIYTTPSQTIIDYILKRCWSFEKEKIKSFKICLRYV